MFYDLHHLLGTPGPFSTLLLTDNLLRWKECLFSIHISAVQQAGFYVPFQPWLPFSDFWHSFSLFSRFWALGSLWMVKKWCYLWCRKIELKNLELLSGLFSFFSPPAQDGYLPLQLLPFSGFWILMGACIYVSTCLSHLLFSWLRFISNSAQFTLCKQFKFEWFPHFDVSLILLKLLSLIFTQFAFTFFNLLSSWACHIVSTIW